jgi:hypothetical protein
MASISLPRISGRGKPASRLPGTRSPPPSPGRVLRVLVFVGPAYGAPAHGLHKRHHGLLAHSA